MNCHYCDKACLHFPPRNHWRCISCKVDYEDNRIDIYTNINGKTYYIRQLNGPYEHPTLVCQGLFTEYHNTKVLLRLTERPHITPQNVAEKIQKYLLFS